MVTRSELRQVNSELTVRGRADGLDRVTDALDKVRGAQERVAAAAEQTTAATDRQARRQTSVAREWSKHEAAVDATARIYQRMERDLMRADRALDQGAISLGRYRSEWSRIQDEMQRGGIEASIRMNIDQGPLNNFLGIRESASRAARESASIFEGEFARLDGLELRAQALRAQIDPLGAAQGRLNDQLAEYNEIAAAGFFRTGELEQLTGQARQKFDDFAASIDLSARAQMEAASAVQRLEDQIDPLGAALRRAISDVGVYDTALQHGAIGIDRYYQSLERLNAAAERTALPDFSARPVAPAFSFRDNLDASFGIGRGGAGSMQARDWEGAFAGLDAQARAVKAQIDPLGVAYQDLNDELDRYRTLQAYNRISTDDLNAVSALARARFDDLAASLRTSGGAVKLTAGQWQGLGYQINDAATMAMTGSGAFQILASQGGQIVQTLADGPGGIRGSLSAIGTTLGGLVTRFPLATAGFLGLGAAAGAFWLLTRTEGPSAEEALKRHADLVRKVGEQYKFAAESARLNILARQPESVLRMQATENERVLQARYREESKKLADGWALTGGPSNLSRLDKFYSYGFQNSIEGFLKSVRDGKPDVDGFRKSVAEIYLDPKTSIDARKVAVELLDASDFAGEIYSNLSPASQMINAASASAERLAQAMKSASGASASLRALVPNFSEMDPRQRIDNLYQQAIQIAPYTSGGPHDLPAIYDKAAALKELDRQLDLTRRSDDLATRSVLARTAAERADIAVLQARIDAERQYGPQAGSRPETKQAEDAARGLVFAQAEASARQTLESARTGAAMVGLTGLPATLAEINARYDDLSLSAAGASRAVADLTRARKMEIETATRAARISPLMDSDQRTRELSAAYDLQAASFGRSAEMQGYLAEKSRLTLDYARQGIGVEGDLASAIETRARAAGLAAGRMDDLSRAQQRAMNDLEDFRRTSRDALGELYDGGDAAGVFRDYFKNKALDQSNELLFGRSGDPGGGLFGDTLGSLFGTMPGQRGDSVANPLFVQPVGPGFGVPGSGPGGIPAVESASSYATSGAGATGPAQAIARTFPMEDWQRRLGLFQTAGNPRYETDRLNPDLGGRLASALEELDRRGIHLTVNDGFRTFEDQVQRRATFGATAARPGYSAHERGNAVDLSINRLSADQQATARDVLGQYGIFNNLRGPAEAHHFVLRPGLGSAGLASAYAPAPTGIGSSVDATLTGPGSTLMQAGQTIASDADSFAGGFGGTLNGLLSGVGRIGDGFLGGFGSVLSSVLNGMGSGTGGGGGFSLGGALGSLATGLFSGGAGGPLNLLPGFAGGGYTGSGDRRTVAGVAHKEEYVFDADATRSIGVPVLEAMRRSGRAPLMAAPAPAAAPAKMQTVNIGGSTVTVQGNADAGALVQMRRMLDERDRAILKHLEDQWRTSG